MDAIITLNAGSSSVKFACFDAETLSLALHGQVERIGAGHVPELTVKVPGSSSEHRVLSEGDGDHADAIAHVLENVIEPRISRCIAMGHRVVHGGVAYCDPVAVDAEALTTLAKLIPFAPTHQPHNVTGIRAAMEVWPETPQIACFDTAFHATIPRERRAFAIPKLYEETGIRRYGFHGLSYDGLTRRLQERFGDDVANGRVVAAHLGNGASLCAIHEGRSQWTTMGLTPFDGLVMGRCCGRIDPGVLLWMMREEGLGADAIRSILGEKSGLLGLSGLSSDMRDILASDDADAAFALSVFVDHIVGEIGQAVALLGGIDILAFTGGIGEHSAPVRTAIVERLEWLGFSLDGSANDGNEDAIEAEGSKPVALVKTNEERTIARHVHTLMMEEAG